MNDDSPLVTVLMSVYNGEKYLCEAIESILNQTFGDFEFIIINDGSTDMTARILNSYQQKDRRIRVIHKTNSGIVDSLNKGLQLCRGTYIARMDADDISLPQRLEKQFLFMESHANIGICGTWVRTFGGKHECIFEYPLNDATLRCLLLFTNTFAHPTVMIRKDFLSSFSLSYSSDYPHAEDYELWVRCSRHFAMANIPEMLLLYRLHDQSVSSFHRETQLDSTQKIRLLQLHNFMGLHPNASEVSTHQRISDRQLEADRSFVIQAHSWLKKLHAANYQNMNYPEPELSNILGEYWWLICNAATRVGLWTLKTFIDTILYDFISLNLKDQSKFIIKCLIKK